MAVQNSLNSNLGNQTGNQILIGNGSNAAVSSITAGTTGQILTGVTSGTPAFQTAGTTGQIFAGVTSGQPKWLTAGTTGTLFAATTSADAGWVSTLNGPFTFSTANVGGNQILEVKNTDNTNANSATIFRITVGGTSAGNPQTSYIIGGSTVWSTGVWNNQPGSSFTISNASVGSSNRMVITSAGYVTFPSTCAFTQAVNPDQTNVTGDGTLYAIASYATSWYDRASNFNATTGVFTAPVSGVYQFNATVTLANLGAGHTSMILYLINNGTGGNFVLAQGNPIAMSASGVLTVSGTINVQMGASNTASLSVQVSGSTKTVTVQSITTKFGGALIA